MIDSKSDPQSDLLELPLMRWTYLAGGTLGKIPLSVVYFKKNTPVHAGQINPCVGGKQRCFLYAAVECEQVHLTHLQRCSFINFQITVWYYLRRRVFSKLWTCARSHIYFWRCV